jgi:hypothetical protein
MARNAESRERYYQELLDSEDTAKGKFEILRSRLAADAKKLPEELQHGAYEDAAKALSGIIEAVGDALEDLGLRHPAGMSS